MPHVQVTMAIDVVNGAGNVVTHYEPSPEPQPMPQEHADAVVAAGRGVVVAARGERLRPEKAPE